MKQLELFYYLFTYLPCYKKALKQIISQFLYGFLLCKVFPFISHTHTQWDQETQLTEGQPALTAHHVCIEHAHGGTLPVLLGRCAITGAARPDSGLSSH